jgi:hypothetical protein
MPHAEPLGPLYSQTAPPGLTRLMMHLLARFPGTHSGGMYNPHSSLSSGRPSPHRVTQALDVMCDAGTAASIIRYMVSIAETVNLQQVIAWHEIVTVQQWARGIRRYPADDHSFGNGHAHIHVGLLASRNWAPSWVGAAGTPTPPAPPPVLWRIPREDEDDMSDVAMLPGPWKDGNLHSFWVDGDGDLGHRWDGLASFQYENLRAILKTGAFLTPQKPLVFVAINGALVVGAFGIDGTLNYYANAGSGWHPQSMPLAH